MMTRLLNYVLRDIGRGRWVILYFAFFFVATEGLLFFTAGEAKTVVGLMNIVLLLIPLAATMFGTAHIHNSRDFIELMLSQPVKRSSIFTALYLGVALPFLAAFLLGTAIPTALHGILFSASVLSLLATGSALTMVFFAIAFYIAIAVHDKAASLGLSFILWLFFAVLYDGIILAITVAFSDYPMETPTIVMVVLNPIDLARIIVMLTFDYAALMGYTGAVFQKFFGTPFGITISAVSLVLWTAVPFLAGLRAFNRKDW
jgi:Cu-processing system permease protein